MKFLRTLLVPFLVALMAVGSPPSAQTTSPAAIKSQSVIDPFERHSSILEPPSTADPFYQNSPPTNVRINAPAPTGGGSTYTLPNNDAGCPADCRQIPWLAGADTWNGNGTAGGGSLPSRTGVNCTTGLTEGNGTTDNTTAIENCLAAISSNQASVLPCGMFYVNGQLDIPSNKSLRGCTSGTWGGGVGSQGSWMTASYHGDTGAGGSPAVTTLKLGVNGWVKHPGTGSLDSTSYNLSSGYTKGSASVVTSSTPTSIAVGDWVIVSELEDSEIPVSIKSPEYTSAMDSCTWCGESNLSSRPMTQIVRITSKSGNTLGLSRPLYYTFKSGLTPRIREITGTGTRSGLESIKLWGSSTSRSNPHVSLEGCMECWIKNVEAYDTPDVGKAYHVYYSYTAALEIRDSYFHFGRGNGGDRNYSPGGFAPNSDAKIENNAARENRHCFALEGGGSGVVMIGNYCDDQFTDDLSYLASGRINHGAHPYMNLIEGNVFSRYFADGYWGTSSHNVFFRNHLWGDATGNLAGWSNSGSGVPDYGFAAAEISTQQHYYSYVGNVLGRADNLHANWNNATLTNSSCGANPTRATPVVWHLGCLGNYDTPGSWPGVYTAGLDAAVLSTLIRHGNYDYKTDGVAHWDGGSNHTIANSLYYPSKPSFYGSCTWPTVDGITGTVNQLPAKAAYELTTC